MQPNERLKVWNVSFICLCASFNPWCEGDGGVQQTFGDRISKGDGVQWLIQPKVW
jgi:hypothetical protein